jgi:hypothetical protein
MKRILIAFIVILAFSAILWPAQTTQAAAKTVTLTVTERQLNATVRGRGYSVDIREGTMVVVGSGQSNGRTIRISMVIRPVTRSGQVLLTISSATANGRAFPRTALAQLNRLTEPMWRSMLAQIAASTPGYRVTGIRFTRNTMRITLTQVTR